MATEYYRLTRSKDTVKPRDYIDLGSRIGESPRPCPMLLTEDIGRGQSRWFRGEVGFKLREAWPPLWGRLEPEFGVPAQDEKVTSARMNARSRHRQTNSVLVRLSTINPLPSLNLWSFINCSFGVLFHPMSQVWLRMDTRSTTNRRLYRFGLFEADLELGTLTRQGVPVKLQEQPFRILALLLESSGEILSRDELRKNIWPDGTYVEFDGSLNTALMKLGPLSAIVRTIPDSSKRFRAKVTGLSLQWNSAKSNLLP